MSGQWKLSSPSDHIVLYPGLRSHPGQWPVGNDVPVLVWEDASFINKNIKMGTLTHFWSQLTGPGPLSEY